MKVFYIVTKQDIPFPELFRGSKDELIAWLKSQADVSKLVVSKSNGGNLTTGTVSEFLAQVANVVGKFYTMDPKTEDLLPNAHHLALGMKVLIGDPDLRSRPEGVESGLDWLVNKVLTTNRWCTVTHLDVLNNSLMLVGVYEDGTKVHRSESTRTPWLVKTESIKESSILAINRCNQVDKIIEEAFRTHERLVSKHDYPSGKIDELIQETTAKVLGLF